jgi:hypothetical protein
VVQPGGVDPSLQIQQEPPRDPLEHPLEHGLELPVAGGLRDELVELHDEARQLVQALRASGLLASLDDLEQRAGVLTATSLGGESGRQDLEAAAHLHQFGTVTP